ncbi:MAG: hypothetical protein ACKVOO_08450 [Burkholderiaceae bacterium]
MNRCACLVSRLLMATAALALWAQTAQAQITARPFPEKALRGTLVVTQPPEVTLNGKAARLSPGARIYNTQNLIQLSGSLVGQELLVNYTRDSTGNVHLVWVLTELEAREARRR